MPSKRPVDRTPWQPWAWIGDTDAVYRSMAPHMMANVVIPTREAILRAKGSSARDDRAAPPKPAPR